MTLPLVFVEWTPFDFLELADDVRVCTDADIDVTDADIVNVVEGVDADVEGMDVDAPA